MKIGGIDIRGVAQRVLAESRDASAYVQRVLEMRPLDREVLRVVIAGQPLYAEETRRRLALAVGLEGDALTNRQVQVAVDRLVAEQIIYPAERGTYLIEDEQLAEWIKSSPDELGLG
jgi:uncharacterized protein